MKKRDRTKAMPGLLIDPHSHVLPHVQLEHQIKFAATYQEIGPGDVLPAIRALATRLGVGNGVVRRAYRELCDAGFLAAERRKHVVVTPGSSAVAEQSLLHQECAERCEQLITWARDNRVSSLALAHLLMKRASAREAESPSFLFIDVCRLAAEESAATVAKAWGIRVAGLSVGDFADLSINDPRRASTLLVNQYLYDDVVPAAGETSGSSFPVRMRLGERLQRRIRRLTPDARVLLVMPDNAFPLIGPAVRRLWKSLFGRKLRVHVRRAGSTRDLTTLVGSQGYSLILLSPVLWEGTPAPIKRSPRVDRVVNEPDPRSLEEIRTAAGVLM